MNRIKFEKISQNEIKFSHKGYKFILEEARIGVYGIGHAVRLYQLNGLDKKFVKCIGCTSGDNHGCEHDKDLHLKGLQNIEQIKQGAVEYINAMLK